LFAYLYDNYGLFVALFMYDACEDFTQFKLSNIDVG